MERDLNKTIPEYGYMTHTLDVWVFKTHDLGKLATDPEIDAVRYLASSLWNCLFGWLVEASYPRCRFVADISAGSNYQCELDCDHDGPHIYNGTCCWYSREMPNWRENNLALLLSKKK